MRIEEKIAPVRSRPNQSSFQKVKRLAVPTSQHLVSMFSMRGAMRYLHSRPTGLSRVHNSQPGRAGWQGQNCVRRTRGTSTSSRNQSTLKRRCCRGARGVEAPLVCSATTVKAELKDDQPRQCALPAVLRLEKTSAGTVSARSVFPGISCRRRCQATNPQSATISVARDHGMNAPIRRRT